MRGRAFAAFASLALAVAIGTGACGEVDHPSCYSGDYLGCLCPGVAEPNNRGFAACTDGVYGACVCDGRTPGVDGSVEASSAPDSGGVDGGKQGFLEACAKSEDCATGLFCKDFPTKGSFCSKSCTTATVATDCPPPSPGCNKDGVCRAP